MKKKEPIKLTIFLDILGFGEMIKTIETPDEAKSIVSKFQILKIFNHISGTMMNRHLLTESNKLSELYEFKVLFVSDSIIISYMPNQDKIIKTVEDIDALNAEIFIVMSAFIAQLQILTIKEFGCFIRGGICDEFSYIDQFHAVGKGIYESHDLESKKAKYPRIVFDKNILTKYSIDSSLSDIDDCYMNSIKFYTVKEDEQYAYINYFNTFALYDEEKKTFIEKKKMQEIVDFVVTHVNIVIKQLEKQNNSSIYEKYEWLEKFQMRNLLLLISNLDFHEDIRTRYKLEYEYIIQRLDETMKEL